MSILQDCKIGLPSIFYSYLSAAATGMSGSTGGGTEDVRVGTGTTTALRWLLGGAICGGGPAAWVGRGFCRRALGVVARSSGLYWRTKGAANYALTSGLTPWRYWLSWVR